MIKAILAGVSALTLGACTYSIAEIDISKSEPSCVRECTNSYSACASSGSSIGFKTETLRACKEAYSICISTCPAK